MDIPMPITCKKCRELQLRIEELEAQLEKHENRDKQLNANEKSLIIKGGLTKSHRAQPIYQKFINSWLEHQNIEQVAHELNISVVRAKQMRYSKDVIKVIQTLTEKQAVKYGFDASEVVKSVKDMVDVDMAHMMNADGSYKENLLDVKAETRRSIKKFKAKNIYSQAEDMNGISQQVITGKLIEVEFYDKLKASELLGREKKIFKTTTVVEHDATANMREILLESSSRANKAAIEVIEVRDESNS